jgi:hypothetical protein
MKGLTRHFRQVARSSIQLVAISALGLTIQAQNSGAQRPPWLKEPHPKPAIYGRVVDSVSGTPIGRAGIRVDGKGFTFTDTSGWYVVYPPSAGPHQVTIRCPTPRLGFGRVIASRAVSVEPETDSILNVQIQIDDCKQPPERTWTAEFRGHYVSGWETSDFVPCKPFEVLDNTAYQGEKQSAWVEFLPGALEAAEKRWPDRGDESYPEVFVRWRASITGPGSYGHLGASNYLMRVQRVLEVRRSGARDCSSPGCAPC